MPEATGVRLSLQKAFDQFRSDPLRYFPVKLRRKRAEQLRALLARPESVDVDAFNREVWLFCSSASVNGQSVQLTGKNYQVADGARLAEFEQALETGRLEFHGNSIWGSGSRIYDPRQKANADAQTGHVREALRALNDMALSPLDKARRIDEVRGFGENIATGLVMVYHPNEFAIYNEQSQQALRKLGYSYHDIETFEQVVSELKKKLGASDFLELDWFLYLVSQGIIQVSEPEEGKRSNGVDGDALGRLADDLLLDWAYLERVEQLLSATRSR